MFSSALVALLYAIALTGCQDSPEAGLQEIVQAAQSGSAEAMYPRLTRRSIALVEAAVLVGGDRGPLAFKQSNTPVEMVSLNHQRGTSIMVVKEGGRSHILPWIQEAGRWKIDLFMMTGFLDGDRIPNFRRPAPP